MPDVDTIAPVAVIGGFALAGESRRGRRYTSGLRGTHVIAGGYGAGSGRWIGGELSSLVNDSAGQTILTNELAQALAAGALSRTVGRRDPHVRAFTTGLMFNAMGDAFSALNATPGQLLNRAGGSSAPSMSSPAKVESAPVVSSAGGNRVEF